MLSTGITEAIWLGRKIEWQLENTPRVAAGISRNYLFMKFDEVKSSESTYVNQTK
jgi:hypothetical protein